MANFFTDIAPNVIFSRDPTAVIDCETFRKMIQHEWYGMYGVSDIFGWHSAIQNHL
jgi:hypothetical protein